MAYNSIYRRYRPYVFEDVVGQEHVIRILTNQIKNDAIGHSYLFTGSRGTGKTSIAKIFARAINCLSPVNGSACGKCSVCMGLKDPSNLDIVEIDAASNNGVDEIRTLIESTKYPPQIGRYKVFIIDEAHMLSKSASNSFLKTLEEPPEYCVFILATTEMHQILPTIVSRCLVMDFRLIPFAKIVDRLNYIFDDLGVTCSPDAVALMANMGEGCMRDALSIADICMSYGNGNITYDDVIQVLGISDPKNILELASGIIRADYAAILKKIDELNNMGKAMSVVFSELLNTFSNLLYIKSGFNDGMFNYEQGLRDAYRELAALADYDKLGRILDVLTAGEGQLRYAGQAKTVVESLCFKAADVRTEINADKLIHRIRELEQKVDKLSEGGIVQVVNIADEASVNGGEKQKAETPKVGISNQPKSEPTPAPQISTPRNISPIVAVGKLIDYLRTNAKRSMLADVISNAGAEKDGQTFTLYVVTEGIKDLLDVPQNKDVILRYLNGLYKDTLTLNIVSRDRAEKEFVDEYVNIFGENIVKIK